jgi:TPR repeat protein
MFGKLGESLAALTRRDPVARFATIERSLAQGWSESAFEQLRALAAEGLAAAQYRIGQAYENADGVVQSLSDAVYWYRLAAAQGNLAAQVRLGLIYFVEPPAPAGLTGSGEQEGALASSLAQFFPHGTTVTQDFTEALRWNELAASQGSAEAQARLGHQYALGLGTTADVAAAEKWFRAAADHSNAEGQLGLGLLYAGSYGTAPDLSQAAHWLELAAASANRIAEYGIGKLLLHGEGTPKDPPRAMGYLERSAAQDYVPAMYLLGMIHWQGEGTAVDLSAGETWLRRAVIRGHGEGACALAQLLLSREDDDGVEAATLLREQADAGNPRAAAALSELYAFGRGVPRDPTESARWRARAASETRPETLIMLASLHAEGIGGTQDFAAAAKLLLEAAERGSVDALYNLGSLHRLGLGVPLNREVAAHYFRRAMQMGSSEAAFQLGLLYSETDETQTQQAAAAAFARAAKAGHERARANLGLLVAEGVGVRRDPEKGLALLEEAARSGDLAARVALGLKLAAGIGEPDLKRALEWLEPAAAAGDADAQAWMGDSHRLGLFKDVDYAAAEEWYRRAASQGHVGSIVLLASAIDSLEDASDATREEAFGLWLAAASAGNVLAQFTVGLRYRDGVGCATDLALATRWLLAAEAQHSEEAHAALNALRDEAKPNADEPNEESLSSAVESDTDPSSSLAP